MCLFEAAYNASSSHGVQFTWSTFYHGAGQQESFACLQLLMDIKDDDDDDDDDDDND